MFGSMSRLAQIVILILLLMFFRSAGITISRSLRFRAARFHSRAFIEQSEAALRECNFDEAISIARRHGKSHIAEVVASGLIDFQSAESLASKADLLASAQRGLERSAALVAGELKRGLSGLATIASTAPFVGLFGTVVGILNAFRGSSLEKSASLAATAGGISEALVTTALGLLVAVPAVWCYNYLSNTLEAFVIEMENASLELVSYLAAQQRRQK
jgi:biopolymer transport protein ExbB/TolQ